MPKRLDVTHLAQIPLYHLLRHFGHLIPPISSPPSLQPGAGGKKASLFSEYLIHSNLSFHTLKYVAKIEIKWVDILGMHLEFDEDTNVLKLFKFPSFCHVLCPGLVRPIYLQRYLCKDIYLVK